MQTILKNALLIATSITILSSCAPSRVYVRERPAAPYVVRPVAPSPNAVWIDGEWVRRGGRYEYVNPHYVAPRRGRMWVPGYWTSTRRGNVWHGGRWK